jgi:hypothetical protein
LVLPPPPQTAVTRLKFSGDQEKAERLKREEQKRLRELDKKPLNQQQTDAIIAAEKEVKDKK